MSTPFRFTELPEDEKRKFLNSLALDVNQTVPADLSVMLISFHEGGAPNVRLTAPGGVKMEAFRGLLRKALDHVEQILSAPHN